MSQEEPDYNDLAYWFPRLLHAGLPVPPTAVATTNLPLRDLVDGPPPGGGGLTDEQYSLFLLGLLGTAARVRYGHDPFFLRTGHTSGKHQWDSTCYVQSDTSLGDHVYHLVEYSALADLVGLPVQTWVCRQLLPTEAVYTLPAYGNMPLVREFRFFVRQAGTDQPQVEHVQPYWPMGAVREGFRDGAVPEDMEAVLGKMNKLPAHLHDRLGQLARSACTSVGGGYWSVDFMQDARGYWWLIDMAQGARSYRYEPEGWQVG